MIFSLDRSLRRFLKNEMRLRLRAGFRLLRNLGRFYVFFPISKLMHLSTETKNYLNKLKEM